MNYKLFNFKVFGDARGKLVPIENNKNIPFEIKRIFYIYDTLPDEVRGCHAHKKCEQIVVAIDGSCQFLLDDGEKCEKIWLNRPDVGLYIGKNIWNEIRQFSYGCKLMVLASEYYDEEEYIRKYDDFKRWIAK